MKLGNQRGNGRLGFVLSMAVVGLVVFLGFKIIPVRITAYNFRDVIRERDDPWQDYGSRPSTEE